MLRNQFLGLLLLSLVVGCKDQKKTRVLTYQELNAAMDSCLTPDRSRAEIQNCWDDVKRYYMSITVTP